MPNLPYQILEPDQRRTSVVFASPHSGRDYSQSFLSRSVLDPIKIRSSEDAFVDQLIDSAPGLGAVAITATVPRAYVDLNRDRSELDPAVVQGLDIKISNPRVASGLGVIPRVVSNGRPIYHGKITRIEAEARLARCWDPYHGALSNLLRRNHAEFGEAILVDCHSMPHEAIEAVVRNGRPKPDVVLGDRFGASAHIEITDQIEAAFKREGLVVARNSPFAGAFIAQKYGRPSRRQHAVQVEIDRALYMDEKQVRPRSDFEAFHAMYARVMSEIAEIGHRRVQVAAE